MSLQLQFVILPIVTLALLGLGFPLYWRHRKDRDYGMWSGWQIFTGFWTGMLGLVFLLITFGVMIPFNPTYWTYNHVYGTVSSVSNRFINGTGDLSDVDYVVSLKGMPGVYNVQDNRIQGVKIGGTVDLTCTVQWVYQGQDQNNCFIRSWAVTR